MLPLVSVQAEDRYGEWMELNIEKSLPRYWSVGAGTELRAEERTRWSIGANVGYKPIKYLKLNASYNFLYRNRPDNRREHYKNDVVSVNNWNGYNLRDAYWSPRHRVSFDATGTVKLWKWFRISVRERYQYTHRMQSTATDAKYRYAKATVSGVTTYELKAGYPEYETDTISAEDSHILRSRLKLSVDKKGWRFEPFVSVEFHNNLGEDIRYLKTSVPSVGGGDFLSVSWIYYLIAALLVAAYFAIKKLMANKIALEKDIVRSRNRKANKVARQRLKLAQSFLSQNKVQEFYEEMHKALLGYTADKLSIQRSDLQRDIIQDTLLSKQVPAEDISSLISLLDDCEMVRYSPEGAAGAMDAQYRKAVELISRFENKL